MLKPFSLLIKPAGANCNLRCDYCFYLEKARTYDRPDVRIMPAEVLERTIRGYLAYDFPEHLFTWQGGEPTLAGLGFFERAVALQAEGARKGTVIGNALQTNGLMIDDAWARFLAEHRFLVGLSLDGPGEFHDIYRRDAAGKGSFDRVMAAAETLERHGVAYNILCMIHKGNARAGGRIYTWFVERGFRHLQFIPCLDCDAAGRPYPFALAPEDYARFLLDVYPLWRENGVGTVSVRFMDSLGHACLHGTHQLCTFSPACPRYLVVERTGDVYPCDFFVDPAWLLGNIEERPLDAFFSTPRYRRFAALKATLPRECLQCPVRDLCNGGCPRDRSDRGRHRACRSLQKIFGATGPDMMRLTASLQDPGGGSGKARQRPGRNDPCPCGSGRKYKKCCMRPGG